MADDEAGVPSNDEDEGDVSDEAEEDAAEGGTDEARVGEKRKRANKMEAARNKVGAAKKKLEEAEKKLKAAQEVTGYGKTAEKRIQKIEAAKKHVDTKLKELDAAKEKVKQIEDAEKAKQEREEAKRQREAEEANAKRDWSDKGTLAVVEARINMQSAFSSRKAKFDQHWADILDLLKLKAQRGEFPASDLEGPAPIERIKRCFDKHEKAFRYYSKEYNRYAQSGAEAINDFHEKFSKGYALLRRELARALAIASPLTLSSPPARRLCTDLFWENNWGRRPMCVAPYSMNAGNAASGGATSIFHRVQPDAPASAASPTAAEAAAAPATAPGTAASDAASPAAPPAATSATPTHADRPASRAESSASADTAAALDPSASASRSTSRTSQRPPSRGRLPDGSFPHPSAPQLPQGLGSGSGPPDATSGFASAMSTMVQTMADMQRAHKTSADAHTEAMQALKAFLERQ